MPMDAVGRKKRSHLAGFPPHRAKSRCLTAPLASPLPSQTSAGVQSKAQILTQQQFPRFSGRVLILHPATGGWDLEIHPLNTSTSIPLETQWTNTYLGLATVSLHWVIYDDSFIQTTPSPARAKPMGRGGVRNSCWRRKTSELHLHRQ